MTHAEACGYPPDDMTCGHGGQDGKSGKGKVSTAANYQELTANAMLVLLAVACSLLDRQIAAQAKAFDNEGGFTERLYRVRSAKRSSRCLSTKSSRSIKRDRRRIGDHKGCR